MEFEDIGKLGVKVLKKYQPADEEDDEGEDGEEQKEKAPKDFYAFADEVLAKGNSKGEILAAFLTYIYEKAEIHTPKVPEMTLELVD